MIVVQHVDAAEAGDSLLYHLFHRLLVAAVKIDGMRIFTDLSNDVLRAFQENVSDDDLCSFAREPFGGGAPNATPPPRDTGSLSLKTLHPPIPPPYDHASTHAPPTRVVSSSYSFLYNSTIFFPPLNSYGKTSLRKK